MARFIETHGNLLKADVDALVNTVNTVGVMGKGIALQFKNAYPANFKAYHRACKSDDVKLGEMFVFDNGQLVRPRWIINFPTKGHWRSNSRINDITAGLSDLRATIHDLGITSIALPPLGCGNGGLAWGDVRPLIVEALEDLDVDILIFPPSGAPVAADMIVATPRPTLTHGKAALISLIAKYSAVALGASLIEVQKLMYFL
jgi:O-acetyl-ADP-ribose deacetylase (regulator of RNase III)